VSEPTDKVVIEKDSRPKNTGLLILLLILAIFLSLRLCYLFLADAKHYPINTVKITASYQHISHKQLESVLSPFLQFSFFSLPASNLQESLNKMDWVDTATVERQWPDTLKIKLIEKKPVAIFGQALMTADGRLFNQNAAVNDINLPVLNGPEQQKKELLQVYQKLSKILAKYGLFMTNLALRKNQAWELTLVNGIKIQMGKKHIERRLTRFCKAYPLLVAEKAEQIAGVDLRYPHGMAVQWKQ